LASFLDLANHHPDSTPGDIKRLCDNVIKYKFNAAFVNPCYITLAKDMAEEIRVGSVVAFPLGQESSDAKVVCALAAAKAGADELDVQMNVGWLRAGNNNEVLREMKTVVTAVKSFRPSVVVKIIIEACLLTDSEVKKASELVLASKADFIKTCSGMGPRGTNIRDIAMVKRAVGSKIRVKVAGGIDTLEEATTFIDLGADRIGTSKAVEIVEEMGK